MTVELSWFAVALVGGAIVGRAGLPVMVGYLLAGAGLGLAGVQATEVLNGIAHAGVLLLLFGVGLHLRVRSLLNRVVIGGGSLHLAISIGVFVTVTVPLGLPLGTALFVGTILSFSSTVLAAKDLENREELGAYYGRVAIGILLVQDVVALALILAVGSAKPQLWALALPALALVRPVLAALVKRMSDDGLLLLFAAMLALGAGELFESAGVPGEIGALLAGALLADHPRADELQQRLWSLKEFFLVGFFLQVGMIAIPHPGALRDALGWVALLTLLLPLKAALFFGLLTALGLRARSAFLSGSALASYSEFTLLAGLAGVERGLISAELFSVITLVTAASFAVNLPVNRMVNAVYERLELRLLKWQRNGEHPDKPLRSLGRSTHMIVGMGRTGAAAYDHLLDQGQRPVGIDADPVVIQRNLAAGRRVVFGDALDPELLDDLSLEHVRGAVISVPNLSARLRTTVRLKEQAPGIRIATYALRDSELASLREAGADDVHHILSDAGVRLAEALGE